MHSIQSDNEINNTISLGIFLVVGYLIKVIVINIVHINASGANLSIIVNYLLLEK